MLLLGCSLCEEGVCVRAARATTTTRASPQNTTTTHTTRTQHTHTRIITSHHITSHHITSHHITSQLRRRAVLVGAGALHPLRRGRRARRRRRRPLRVQGARVDDSGGGGGWWWCCWWWWAEKHWMLCLPACVHGTYHTARSHSCCISSTPLLPCHSPLLPWRVCFFVWRRRAGATKHKAGPQTAKVGRDHVNHHHIYAHSLVLHF